jgi:ketosteroid isomerase-like protein
MATVTTEMKVPAAPKRLHVDRWLVVAIIALAAFVGLGAWVLVDRFAGGDDVTALVDENLAAVSNADAAGVGATYTEDATANILGEVSNGRQEIIAWIEGIPATQIARTSDVVTSGEYAVFFNEWTAVGRGGADLSVMRLENGKIAGHWEFYLPNWPPLELDR